VFGRGRLHTRFPNLTGVYHRTARQGKNGLLSAAQG
jgi:hypothetical protein